MTEIDYQFRTKMLQSQVENLKTENQQLKFNIVKLNERVKELIIKLTEIERLTIKDENSSSPRPCAQIITER